MEETYLSRWRVIGLTIATALVIFGIFAAPLHSTTFKSWDWAALAMIAVCEIVGRVIERKRADW